MTATLITSIHILSHDETTFVLHRRQLHLSILPHHTIIEFQKITDLLFRMPHQVQLGLCLESTHLRIGHQTSPRLRLLYCKLEIGHGGVKLFKVEVDPSPRTESAK